MPFLLDPNPSASLKELVILLDLDRQTFLTGSTGYYTANELWQRPLSQSAHEVSESISPWFSYPASADRLTGSNATQRDFDFQEAELLLAGANMLNRRKTRIQERGGQVGFTGYRDSLNVLKSFDEAKKEIYDLRKEAKELMNKHIWTAVSASLSGSALPNFTPDGTRVIGSGKQNRLNKGSSDSTFRRIYGRCPDDIIDL